MNAWGLRDRYDEIRARLVAGDSYHGIARDLGCTVGAIKWHADRWGLQSQAARNMPQRIVEIDGERMALSEAARRYGLKATTVWMRYDKGDRGRDLVRPAKRLRRPGVYALDIPREQWNVYAELAREIGQYKAAKKLDVPAGAIGAAMRGEWHRLD